MVYLSIVPLEHHRSSNFQFSVNTGYTSLRCPSPARRRPEVRCDFANSVPRWQHGLYAEMGGPSNSPNPRPESQCTNLVIITNARPFLIRGSVAHHKFDE